MSKPSIALAPRLRLAALVIVALTMAMGTADAQVFTQPDIDFKGQLRTRARMILPGTEIELGGTGFKPGQKVTLLRGATVLNSEPYVADEEGRFVATLSIPADAATGSHPVVVRVENPDAAFIYNLKVSKELSQYGAEKFDVVSKKLSTGLYQVDYSAASNALFVTSAFGRPIAQSELLKVDPETLEIVARATPPEIVGSERGGVQAVYGVGVDDANGTVWATNTRTGTVAVYKQSDLSLVKQYDAGLVPHSRDVIVDTARNRAYVSGRDPVLAVFDTKTLEQLPSVELQSTVRGEDFFPMSLHLDKASGKLFTVSLMTSEAAVVDLASGSVEKIFEVPNADTASGVAYDSANQRLLIANQGSDNLLIVDPQAGKVVHDVYVGAGALNVAYEPVSKLAFVSCRGAGTIAVVDGNGELVANIDGGTFPNHVQEDGKGNIFSINKSRGEDDATGDRVTRISLKK